MLREAGEREALKWTALGRDAIRRAPQPEVGWFDVEVVKPDPLLQAQAPGFRCFLSRFDEVVVGEGDFDVLARSERCDVEAMRIPRHPAWGRPVPCRTRASGGRGAPREAWGEHPELGIETRADLVRAIDTSSIWRSIYAGFLGQLDGHQFGDEGRALRRTG